MTSSLVMPPMLSLYRLSRQALNHRQSDNAIAENGDMENIELRQILARNLRQAMAESTSLHTQAALAGKAGMAQSHLSEILRAETSATTDMIATLARALGREPWELLANDEATRQAALQKMILGPRISNERAAEKLPPAPTKEGAKRKKGGGGEQPPSHQRV